MSSAPIAIANDASGGGSGGDDVGAWCDGLGIERRAPGDDLAETVRAAAAETPPYLAVAGGDGTVRTAVDVLAGGAVPLLPVPGGTFNHFAKSLGIDDLDAATRAATDGVERHVPIAEVNGEVFLNTCVVGWYPEMVRTRERLRAKLPRPVALVAAFAVHLPRLRTFQVQIDDRSHRVWLLWVGAARFGLEPGELTERGRDDVVDVRLLLARGRFPRVRILADLVRRRLPDSDHLERFVADTAVVARLSTDAVDAALDAEVVRLRSPLCFQPTARTLVVRAPR